MNRIKIKKSYKRLMSRIVVFLMVMIMCIPTITAFADDYDDEIDAYKNSLQELSDETDDSDLKSKYDKLIEQLFSDETKDKFLSADSDYTTIRATYSVINHIVSEVYGESPLFYTDLGASALTTKWKEGFRTLAESYGVNFGSLSGANTAEADFQNSAVKVNILTWNNTTNSAGDSLDNNERGVISEILEKFDGFTDFTAIISGIAVALTITFGCSKLLTMSMDKNLSDEGLVREFAKIMFGVWIIFNYKFFALLIIRLGTLVTENVLSDSGISNQGKIVYKCLCQSISELAGANGNIFNLQVSAMAGLGNWWAGLTNSLGNGLSSITSFIGGGFVQLASAWVIYAVAIEIGIRYLFTPIAIADLYSEKFRSNGFMYIKKLLACSMQGAIIYAIIFGTDALKSSFVGILGPITSSAINLTMCGMFAKSRQIANDIIGVH